MAETTNFRRVSETSPILRMLADLGAIFVFLSALGLAIWGAVESWDSFTSTSENVLGVWAIIFGGFVFGLVFSLIIKVLAKIATRD